MNKRMIIVNGFPESGKTTFANISEEILRETYPYALIVKTSIVNPIKELALANGWDGEKTPAARRMLSDLKDMMDRYCSFSKQNFKKFYESGDYIFVDAREPYDIAYAVETYGAISVFIDKKPVDMNFSNHADTNVLDYNYDYMIDNNGTLEEFKDNIRVFLETIEK